MSSSQLFVIGYDNFWSPDYSQFLKVCAIPPYPEKENLKTFSGHSYSIYTDDNYGNLWSIGRNWSGCCGVGKAQLKQLINLTPITYFNKHGIILKKVFVNPSGYGSFFISKG